MNLPDQIAANIRSTMYSNQFCIHTEPVTCSTMADLKKIYPVIIIFFSLNSFHCQRTENVRNIVRDIFKARKYDKRIRPVQNFSDYVLINISFGISGINFLDEKTGVFSVTGFLDISWKDEFLIWQPEVYDNVTSFTLPQGNTWLPDLILTNGVKNVKEWGGDSYYLLINHTGEIGWWPYQVFQTYCEIDVVYFPFDTQTCDLVFSIWNHDISMVQMSPGEITLYEYHENGVWTLSSNKVTVGLDETKLYSKLRFSFTLRRKYKFYLWNLIFPLILLGILKICSFFIPAQNGEKVSFAITLFLSYGVFLNLIISSLPENSDSISLVCAYTEVELTLGVLLVFIASIQVKICSRDHRLEFSKYDIYLIRIFYKKECLQKCMKNAKEGKTDWTLVTSAIDKLMIILMMFIEILMLCIFSLVFLYSL